MLTLSLCQVQDLSAAVLNDNENKAVPDEITVCSTMYIDMDDCDGMTPNRAKRIYPTWSIINEEGKAEMSFFIQPNEWRDKLFLKMGKQNQKQPLYPYNIGKLQFYLISIYIIFSVQKLC